MSVSAKGFLFLTVHHHLGDFEPKNVSTCSNIKQHLNLGFVILLSLSCSIVINLGLAHVCMCVCVCVKVTIFPLSLSPKTNPLFLSVLVYYRLLILNRQRTEMAVNISLSFLFLPFSLARAHF